LDIRKWYKKDGTLEPTKKGINLNPADIGNLHKALMRADKWIKMGKG
jgi:hypothetical protein